MERAWREEDKTTKEREFAGPTTTPLNAGASATHKSRRSYVKGDPLVKVVEAVSSVEDLEAIFLRDSALFRDCVNQIPLAESEDLEDALPWDVP